MSHQLDITVYDAVQRALNASQRGAHRSFLDRYLAHPETRNRCYLAALQLAAENRRYNSEVANLLLTSLTGFAPTNARIYEQILEFAASNLPEGSLYGELHRLTEGQFAEWHRFLGTGTPRDGDGSTGSAAVAAPYGASTGSSASPSKEMALSQQQKTGGMVTDFHHPLSPDALHYTTLPAFRGPASEHSRRLVSFYVPSIRECREVSTEKNRKLLERLKKLQRIPRNALTFVMTQCKDYAQQTPMLATPELVQDQIQILAGYSLHYDKNAQVALATKILVKLLFDGYRSKMYLSPEGDFFRTVSCAFVTPLFTLIGSDYLCVKLQTYEILVNIGVHAQLFQRTTTQPGAGVWVEKETYWLLSSVIQRQLLQGERDERVWVAALKAVLFMLPPEEFANYLDPRVMQRFAVLPGIAQLQPLVYTSFMEGLAHCLCAEALFELLSARRQQQQQGTGSNTRVRSGSPSSAAMTRSPSPTRPAGFGGPPGGGEGLARYNSQSSMTSVQSQPHSSQLKVTYATHHHNKHHTDPNHLPHGFEHEKDQQHHHSHHPVYCRMAALEQMGGKSMVLQLYVDAATAEARDALFTVLFAATAMKQKLFGEGHPPMVYNGVRTSLELGLPWHLHSLLLYQTPMMCRELQQQLVLDLPFKGEEKSIFLSILSDMLASFAKETQQPPVGFDSMPIAVATCLLPNLCREEDSVMQQLAAAAAFSSVKREIHRTTSSTPGGAHEAGEDRNVPEEGHGSGDAAANIGSSGSGSAAPAALHEPKLRDCLPLLTALATMTSPTQRLCAVRTLERLAVLCRTEKAATRPFGQLLHLLLQRESSPGNLMIIFRAVLSLLTRQVSERGDGDVSAQVISGALQATQSSIDYIGSQALWALYFGLRQDAADSSLVVRQARHVIVSVLALIRERDAPSALVAWTKVLEDGYAPVAICGAQQIIHISGVVQYDRYEAALNEAQRAQKQDVLKSAYHMASSIAYQ